MKSGRDPRGDGEGHRRLAVLIDADNAQATNIDALLAEVARYGTATVKRIYGDWTSTSHQQWKKVLLRHSISPVQQFAYTSGKNSTDSALIIDAMDLMHAKRFDGFCLVSSDSDFTRLAQRLREEGLTVYGFGEKKTPAPFVAACDKFIYTEVLRAPAATAEALVAASPALAAPSTNGDATRAPAAATTKPRASADAKAKTKPRGAVVADARSAPPAIAAPFDLILQAIDESSDDAGWASLGAIGNYLTKVRPDFDPRLYGHRKLSQLLKSEPRLFEIEERQHEGSSTRTIHVRAAR